MAQRKKKKLPVLTTTTYDFKENPPEGFEYPTFFIAEDEFEGEGLPPKIQSEEHPFFDSTYDVRASHYENGNFVLTFAAKNSNKHTVQIFEGLNQEQVHRATRKFLTHLNFVVKKACICWAWACYDGQRDDEKIKTETFDSIIEQITNRYKDALIWQDRRKEIENTLENGVRTIKTIPIQGGRPKDAKNKVPSVTIEQVKNTILKFKQSSAFPTQAKVARRLNTTPRTIQRCLKKSGIKLKYNDFVHSIINQK